MALRKAILGVSATGVAAGGVVLGKVGAEDTLKGFKRRNVKTGFLATPSSVFRAVQIRGVSNPICKELQLLCSFHRYGPGIEKKSE